MTNSETGTCGACRLAKKAENNKTVKRPIFLTTELGGGNALNGFPRLLSVVTW